MVQAEEFKKKEQEDWRQAIDESFQEYIKLEDAEVELEKAKAESFHKIQEDAYQREQDLLQKKAGMYQYLIDQISSAVYDFTSDSENGMQSFARNVVNWNSTKSKIDLLIFYDLSRIRRLSP